MRNLLSAVSGTVFDDFDNDGIGDAPAEGVEVELFLDNGDGILDEATDTLVDSQTTAADGSYTFGGVSDGKYHVRQQVPAGSVQSAGPAYYTLDVAGEAVGLLVDDFEVPDPPQNYFINAFDADPTHLEADGDGILGGQRDLLVDVLGTANFISAGGTVGFHDGIGEFQFASAGPGTKAILQYDGVDADVAGPPADLAPGTFPEPIDLTAGGLNSALRIDFNMLQVGEGKTELDIEIEATSSGGSAVFSGFVPESVIPSSYSVSFASFTPTGDFSFEEITRLEVRLNELGVAAVDLQLDTVIAENPGAAGYDFANFIPTATITGTKYDDSDGDGQPDGPRGGVTIELFLDNGDKVFDEATDTLIDTDETDAATGQYTFDRLTDGTYHVREQVPVGDIQTGGQAVYTFDAVAGTVGLLIDDFADPDPNQTYFIDALDPDPTHLEADSDDILGGQRDVLIDVQGASSAISAMGSIGFHGGIGDFRFASAAPGTLAVLQYDGVDEDLAGPPAELLPGSFDSPIDVTAGGLNTALRIDFDMLQVGEGLDELNLLINVTSVDGSASFSGMVPEDAERSSYSIPFADFTTTAGSFSFTEVTSLELSINLGGVADVDFEIDCILAENPEGAGFDFVNFTVLPGIDIEKTTNGSDADDPTGPMVPAGEAVTWTYLVTNPGNVALGNLSVTDDQGASPTLISGDDNGDGLLDLSETWIYEATGIAIEGQYGNVGTAVGTPLFDGQPIEGFDDVEDTDPSHYFGVTTGIDIEKFTNGEDADDPTGPMIPEGDPVTWLYVVSNTGNVALDVTVTDDTIGDIGNLIGGDDNNDGLLDPNEIWTYEATGVATAGQYINVATAVGIPFMAPEQPIEGFEPVDDSDPSHYFGVTTGIVIEKSTNGLDADDPTGPYVPVGDPVTWSYAVTNTGNVPLDGVTVSDDQPGVTPIFTGDDDGNNLLDPNETWTYEAIGTAVEGQYANVGSVIATPVDESGQTLEGFEPVDASDPSHYFGANAGIDIQKATNGDDADIETGPVLPVGAAVTWTYVVTNTGNMVLGDVSVSDDQGVTLTLISNGNGDDVLEPGEIWTYEASGNAIAGQYANVGGVTANPIDDNGLVIPNLPEVSDSDPSHYFGVVTGIDIEKSTNDEDADVPPGPNVLFGETVIWDYEVTTTSNVALANVTVIDDAGTPGDPGDDFSPDFIGGDTNNNGLLDVGETWTYQKTGTWQLGQYGNLAIVVGTPADEDGQPIPDFAEVTDDDPSHYFGLALSSLSGYVYVDANDNGIMDPIEARLKNAVIYLIGTDGLGNNVFQQATTDQNGLYFFSDLLPGKYTLQEEQPWAFLDGKDTIGTPGGTTSNDKFSDIVLPPDFDGVGNNFGELALIPPLVSKSLFTWPLDAWKEKYDGRPDGPLGTTPSPELVEVDSPAQIVDNLDDGFSLGGQWSWAASQGFGPGVHYSAAGNGSSTATWTFEVTPGQYDVAATWSRHRNRASNSPFTVYDGSAAQGTVRVNQELAPGDFADLGQNWESLGTFTITGNSLVVKLTDRANEYVIADAVRIQRVGDLPPAPAASDVQIVDNLDDGFELSGQWRWAATQGFGPGVHYSAAGTGSSTAAWNFSAAPGQYRVAATWSQHTNRASNAPFTVYAGSDSLGTTVRVNQELAPDDLVDQGQAWENLGTFTITGNSLMVKLTDRANEYVIADAIRIERIGDLPPVPAVQIVDNVDAAFGLSGQWGWAATQGFGPGVHYSAAGSGSSAATWTFSVTPGQYEVATTWRQHGNRATDAPFTVYSGSTALGTVRLNQELAPNDFVAHGEAWENLGNFTVAGNKLVVMLTDQANEYVIADAVRIRRVDASPLIAAGGIAPTGGGVAALTQAELLPIVAEAISRWEAPAGDTDFSQVDFVIADLADSLLGLAEGNTIYIDRNAAGHGWFVDQTPGRDEEFLGGSDDGALRASILDNNDPRAADRIDLLTVVAHELGHTLGLADLDAAADDLMSGRLQKGLRREPGGAEIDAVLAGV